MLPQLRLDTFGMISLKSGAVSVANHLSYDVLSRLLERKAPQPEQAEAGRHLSSCARCRSELEWLQRVRSWPARKVDQQPPPESGWRTQSGSAPFLC